MHSSRQRSTRNVPAAGYLAPLTYLVADDDDGEVVRVDIQPHQQFFSPHGHLTTNKQNHTRKTRARVTEQHTYSAFPQGAGSEYIGGLSVWPYLHPVALAERTPPAT